MLDKVFKLQENKTNVKTEILAGLTTFLSMAYILAVNPIMLAEAGMSKESVFLSTALASAISTILMGLLANYPVALSSGMGINAFFTYTMCLTYGYSYQAALAAVFVSGVLFLIVSLTGIRKYLINVIPKSLKFAIGAGIGFFIAFIGLKDSGIVVSNPSTFVSLGDLKSPPVALSVLGIIITIVLYIRKINFAVFLGIIITSIIGLILGVMGFDAMPRIPSSIISLNFDTSTFFIFKDGFRELFERKDIIVVLFSLLFVDFFDTTGSLIAVSSKTDLMDKNGNIKNIEKAFVADSVGTIIGTTLGTSTITTFVESTSGIAVGGRTGLTAVTTGVLFLLATLFYPLLSFVTTSVTAPALILVGILMAQQLSDIDWKNDAVSCIASFMTIIGMMLTYSIADGMGIGFLSYTLCMLAKGKLKEIPLGILILDVIFILFFLM